MRSRAELTPERIRAAGRDAGNRSMRAAGRKAWSAEDWNAATLESDRLLAIRDGQALTERGWCSAWRCNNAHTRIVSGLGYCDGHAPAPP